MREEKISRDTITLALHIDVNLNLLILVRFTLLNILLHNMSEIVPASYMRPSEWSKQLLPKKILQEYFL
jgi:hypothetical protein